MPKPIVLAVTSDHHTNSTIGLCPPEGVKLDDGGRYTPSKAQRWQWERWEAFWKEVAKVRAREKAALYAIFNGDLVDGGPHHGTTQIVSANLEIQSYIADRVFSVPQALKPDAVFVVRGTEAHTGPSASSEEALARHLKAERDSDGRWSFWHLRTVVNGVRIDCQHHGRGGLRPWTHAAAMTYLAAHIFFESTLAHKPPPALAFRSHIHKFGDSGSAFPTRVIQTPAWQLKTAYAHKVVPESISDVGGVITVLRPGELPDVRPILYQPELPAEWRPRKKAA